MLSVEIYECNYFDIDFSSLNTTSEDEDDTLYSYVIIYIPVWIKSMIQSVTK